MKINDIIRIPRSDKLASALVTTAGTLARVQKSPDERLGELFSDVQKNQIYHDGKTFVDLIPVKRAQQIKKEYQIAKKDPDFNLQEFVARHFHSFSADDRTYVSDRSRTVRQHITDLWPVLERRNRIDRGSLVALPYKYFVPGGRFDEQFYWDSYFIMLGLAADERWTDVENIIKNCAYMIRKFGYIPNANRTYLLSRSQPPFFSHMLKLLAEHKGRKRTMVEYLPYMVAEHAFWMKGGLRLLGSKKTEYARVVELPDGLVLNRYFDNKSTPRPESLREDMETSKGMNVVDADRLYLNLRAGAESGWDFSTRWFEDDQDLETIRTTELLPVDLNCLLYHLETTIAETYRMILQPVLAKKFQKYANVRLKAINKHLWSDTEQFYFDFDLKKGHIVGQKTLAAAYPLYVKAASNEQAAAIAKVIKDDFLKTGGLITTLQETGQQWDSPNGWAPLQWVAIVGLRNYGYTQLANEIKRRWIATNTLVYEREGKLIEKYNVVDPDKLGGGGEYALQDGFGWTNGVLAALIDETNTLRDIRED